MMGLSLSSFSQSSAAKMTLPKGLLALCLLAGALTACDQQKVSTIEEKTIESNVDRANPAAVYCVEQGGEYILDSGQCKLASGESVSAWELYRHRHQS